MMRFVFRGAMKRSWLSLCVPIVACLAQASMGAPVSFSTLGNGVANATVATFDELPGNALAVGGTAAINEAVTRLGTAAGSQATSGAFTLLYQANLILLDPAGNQIVTAPGVTFTAVAKFQETATVTRAGDGSVSTTVNFNLAGNQAGSYLDFFAVKPGAIGNNLTGVGFTSQDNPNATLIYVGSVASTGPAGNFQALGGTAPLDSFSSAGSQLPSVVGVGATQLNFATTFFNTSYFVTNPGPTITFSTTNATPFTTVDTAQKLISLTQSGSTITSFTYVTPSLGTTNGAGPGPDFQFQADASSSFAVPEPASFAMTLLGLGGMGLGAVVTRRRAKARATAA